MDGPHESPRLWHFTEHRQLAWVLVPSAAILLLLGGAFLGAQLSDDPVDGSGADWTVPAIALSIMAAVPLAIGGALALGERFFERRLARRTVDTATAVWPQYATERQWERACADRASSDAGSGDWLPWAIGVPTVVIAGLAVWAIAQDAVVAVPPLVAFWLLVVGLAVGRSWRLRRRVAEDLERRARLAPTPRTWVSPEGVYDEDNGLIRIDQIVSVSVVDGDDLASHRTEVRDLLRRGGGSTDLGALDTRLAKSGWGFLAITTDTDVARTFGRKFFKNVNRFRSYGGPIYLVHHVRVPPGDGETARSAADAIRRRWSIPSTEAPR